MQPNLDGVSLGLGYFAVPSASSMCPFPCQNNVDCVSCGGVCNLPSGICSGAALSCDPMDYAKPEVEIAPLPGISGAIVTSLGMHMPSTNSPMSAPLERQTC